VRLHSSIKFGQHREPCSSGSYWPTIIAVTARACMRHEPLGSTRIDPLIQIFKTRQSAGLFAFWPFIVHHVYYAVNAAGETFFNKAFLISARRFACASLWPTSFVNTTSCGQRGQGFSLTLPTYCNFRVRSVLFKIILPASLR